MFSCLSLLDYSGDVERLPSDWDPTDAQEAALQSKRGGEDFWMFNVQILYVILVHPKHRFNFI